MRIHGSGPEALVFFFFEISEEGDCLVPQNAERAFGDSVVLRCMRRRLFVFDA